MSVISSRYAEALLSLVSSPEEADQTGTVLEDFSFALENEADFRTFMLNPAISPNIKKETLSKLTGSASPDLSTTFLFLLIDKERLSALSDIQKKYVELKAQRRNLLRITVFSALPLDESQLKAIGDKYTKIYGSASVHVETQIDASLLGGVCVQIGDIRIDDTLLGRLQGLRLALTCPDGF